MANEKKVVKAADGKAQGNEQAKAAAPQRSVQDRNAVIEVLTTTNPKRGASRSRFAHYQTGMTVGEYVELAGSKAMADIRWDQEAHAPENKPFIKLHPAGSKLVKGKRIGA